MLFRRHDWIPASSLNYTEVGDINVALKELLDRRFIVDSMVLEFIIIIHHQNIVLLVSVYSTSKSVGFRIFKC